MLLTAFVLGLTSSLHCVGMCGPIALALPGRQRAGSMFVWGRLTYQAGRVATYMMLGAAIGLFGEGFNLIGYQDSLSVGLGALFVVVGIFSLIGRKQAISFPIVEKLLIWLRRAMGPLLQRGEPHTLFQLGILNGLLPCGFVYLALAGGLATGQFWQGIAYMALFGLGTWPAMLAVSLAGGMLSPKIRSYARPLMLGMTFVIGGMLILRGLNLGIPFLSPLLISTEAAPIVECH